MITGNRLEWRKSTFSGNGENCVEVAPSHGWRTSSFSGRELGFPQHQPIQTRREPRQQQRGRHCTKTGSHRR